MPVLRKRTKKMVYIILIKVKKINLERVSNMSKKLYRYRAFNPEMINDYSHIHQSMINIEKWKFEAFEGLVYPSSPLYFNDPYDCEFCFQNEALENALDREMYIHLLGRKISLKKEERDRILYSENLERALKIILQIHGMKFKDSFLEILNERIRECVDEIKDAVRVVCLSEVYDSMLMWSHYAQNHKGYCIEYDFEKDDMVYKHIHPVIYKKERYAITGKDMLGKNTEWIYKATCTKSDVWSYEKEWRIVTANFNKVMPQKLEYPNGKYVLNFKNNIKSFYLGAKISSKLKNEIIQFGKKNGITVYQMMLSPTTYELEAQKII